MINEMQAADGAIISDAAEASCRWIVAYCLTTSVTQEKIKHTMIDYRRIKFELQRTKHNKTCSAPGPDTVDLWHQKEMMEDVPQRSTGRFSTLEVGSRAILMKKAFYFPILSHKWNLSHKRPTVSANQAHLQGIEGCDLRTMGQRSPKTHGKRCVLSPGRSLANPLDMIFVVL